jgi:hypothetical protein
MKKISAPALKCSHILTNRQRREIITYKNEARHDHLIRVFPTRSIGANLRIKVIIEHLSENSKGFLMEKASIRELLKIL